MSYSYQGNPLFVPCDVEIAPDFRPGGEGRFFDIVQHALQTIEPWRRGEEPAVTFETPRRMGARVVKLTTDEEPVWQVNLSDHSKRRGVAPHVRLARNDRRRSTNRVTVELKWSPDNPLLCRIYPGDYIPPLPSLPAAQKSDETLQQSFDFWDSHALLYSQRCQPSDPRRAPTWYGRIV